MRAHLLLCLLAYSVEWHLREAWREQMFADADPSAQATRDPVAPAQRSKAAMTKINRRKLDDGPPVHGFSTRRPIFPRSCATPAAYRGRPMHPTSRGSLPPRLRSATPSISSNASGWSQNPAPPFYG